MIAAASNLSWRQERKTTPCKTWIFIGISASKIYCKVLEKAWLRYEHHQQSYYFNIDGRDFKLVPMNPGNAVNYKLTLNVKYLDDISKFNAEILKIAVLANMNQ